MNLFSHEHQIAAEDYDVSSLPKTRWEVFQDVCRLHWGKLLLLGLLMLLFVLPLLLCGMYRDVTLLLLQEQVEQNRVDGPNAALLARQLRLFCALINVFLLVLFSVGLAGIMRIIKRYAWLENVNFSYDFIQGIRQNFRQCAALMASTGGFVVLCTYAHSTIPLVADGLFYDVAAYVPGSLCLLFLLPVGALMIPCIAIYDNKMSQHVRYGILLFLKYSWRVLLCLAVCASPMILMMVPKLICRVIGGVATGVLLPVALLAWFLVVSGWLDREVNQEYYPQLVEKGLLGLKGENVS